MKFLGLKSLRIVHRRLYQLPSLLIFLLQLSEFGQEILFISLIPLGDWNNLLNCFLLYLILVCLDDTRQIFEWFPKQLIVGISLFSFNSDLAHLLQKIIDLLDLRSVSRLQGQSLIFAVALLVSHHAWTTDKQQWHINFANCIYIFQCFFIAIKSKSQMRVTKCVPYICLAHEAPYWGYFIHCYYYLPWTAGCRTMTVT